MALTNAASIELEPIWATLLAKALEGKNVKDLLSNVGSGGGAPAASGSAAPAASAGAAAEAPKEEEKAEEKEESDDDMVCITIIIWTWVLLMYFYFSSIGLRTVRLICICRFFVISIYSHTHRASLSSDSLKISKKTTKSIMCSVTDCFAQACLRRQLIHSAKTRQRSWIVCGVIYSMVYRAIQHMKGRRPMARRLFSLSPSPSCTTI